MKRLNRYALAGCLLAILLTASTSYAQSSSNAETKQPEQSSSEKIITGTLSPGGGTGHDTIDAKISTYDFFFTEDVDKWCLQGSAVAHLSAGMVAVYDAQGHVTWQDPAQEPTPSLTDEDLAQMQRDEAELDAARVELAKSRELIDALKQRDAVKDEIITEWRELARIRLEMADSYKSAELASRQRAESAEASLRDANALIVEQAKEAGRQKRWAGLKGKLEFLGGLVLGGVIAAF